MSEYQYFEFQAIDRPLTQSQMQELRRYSTRATITPTRFVNEYHWGNFKGNPAAWMEKYFDAFFYWRTGVHGNSCFVCLGAASTSKIAGSIAVDRLQRCGARASGSSSNFIRRMTKRAIGKTALLSYQR